MRKQEAYNSNQPSCYSCAFEKLSFKHTKIKYTQKKYNLIWMQRITTKLKNFVTQAIFRKLILVLRGFVMV